MTSITHAFSNLISAIVDIFTGVFDTFVSALQSVFAVISTALMELLNLFKGLLEVLLGNIFIIGTVAAVFLGYTLYKQKQGKPVLAEKKTA